MPNPRRELRCIQTLLPLVAAALAALDPGPAHGVERRDTLVPMREQRVARSRAVLDELAGFLSLPNVATDSVAIRDNASHLRAMLEQRGIATRLLETPGAPPAVFGELQVAGARRTVVLYAHYDGQPVDAAAWRGDPWRPVLRDAALEDGGREVALEAIDASDPACNEWRLYARSASDDKAPIVAMLAALDALRAAGMSPSVHLKFFFEGEEEQGSPHLAAILRRHAALLAADVWLFCDGPVHQSRRPQVFFGVRGVQDLEMTVYGPARALHSGHYGNWAPNPIALLTNLLASMRDADGRIRVDGFDRGLVPLTPEERRAAGASPAVEAELRRAFGLAWNESGDARLVERLLLPAMNLRGIAAGGVGAAAANAIPTEARASIDFRLVPGQTPEGVRLQVEAHVERQGFHVVHEPPDLDLRRTHARIVQLDWGPGYPAMRTSMDLPVSRALLQVVRETAGEDTVVLPSLGGSVPMYVFVEELGAPVIGLPIVNHDNNQHAADENLRLQNLWDGIDLYAAVMLRLGTLWP